MGAPTYVQVTFRIRNDDGSESAATWKEAQGDDSSINVDTKFRVRFLIDETASKSWAAKNWNLYYNHNSGGYNAVTDSTPIQITSSTYFTNGDDALERLTGGADQFLVDNNGMVSATGGCTNSSAVKGDWFDVEYCLIIDSAQVANNDTILLQVYDGTSALNSYTDTPTITVIEAATVELTNVGAIASAEAFGTATVAGVAKTISDAGAIASAEAFGTATVAPYVPPKELTNVGNIASAEAFGTADVEGQTAPEVVDSYSESNQDSGDNIASGADYQGMGQTFTGDGKTLYSVEISGYKVGSPTGNIYLRIYAISGTYGTDAIPSGSALAISDAIDISTLGTGSPYLIEFLFSGANLIELEDTVKYALTIEYSGGSSSDYLKVYWDISSPTHDGNIVTYESSTWTGYSVGDFCFYVYGTSGGTDVNLTNAGDIASAEAFGTATVAGVAKEITTAGEIASAEAFGQATVTPVVAAEEITDVGNIASAEAFGTATVAGVAKEITDAGAIATAEAFGTGQVSQAAAELTDAGAIASAEAHGTQVVGLAVESAGAIATAEAFGTATVSQVPAELTDAGDIASAEAFGQATVGTPPVSLTNVGDISSSEVFGTAAVTQADAELTGAGEISSAEAFGTATVTPVIVLSNTGDIASAEAFGTATVAGADKEITGAGDIASAEAFGTCFVGTPPVQLTDVGDISSAEVFGTATITQTPAELTDAGDIATAEAFGTATVEPVINLTGTGDIASAEAFGTATITQLPAELTDTGDISTAEAFGIPTVSSMGIISLTDVGGILSAEAFGRAWLFIIGTGVHDHGLAGKGELSVERRDVLDVDYKGTLVIEE